MNCFISLKLFQKCYKCKLVTEYNLVAMPPKNGTPRDRGKSINVQNEKTDEGGKKVFSEGVFRNLRHATRFAIDIGGSLAKVVYISKVSFMFGLLEFRVFFFESFLKSDASLQEKV